MKRVVIVADPGTQFEAALGALSAAGFEAQRVTAAGPARSLIEAGAVAVVVLSRETEPIGEAAKDFKTLAPALRRGLVLAVIGANLTTGDGVRAFLLNADLVVGSGDLARLGDLLAGALVAKRALVAGLDPLAAVRLGG